MSSAGPAPKFAPVAATATGDNEVVAAVAGKRIRVLSYAIVSVAAETATWNDGVSDFGAFTFAANGGLSFAGDEDAPAFETGNGLPLNLASTGGGDVTGHLTYILV